MATREIPRVVTNICDRCKAEHDMTGPNAGIKPKGWISIQISTSNSVDHYLICHQCKDALWRFLQIREVKAVGASE